MDKILLTGATGYIGGRLLPELLRMGRGVRCLLRDAGRFDGTRWPGVELSVGDLLQPETLLPALEGISTAYYLVHSMMAAGRAYRERDRILAKAFAEAATEAQLERAVYMGGLGETGAQLSEHLTSRREVEGALALGSVPLTVVRAAMIIGSGSTSFEILRYLVERLPVMITKPARPLRPPADSDTTRS